MPLEGHHPRRLGLSTAAVESRWSINDHRARLAASSHRRNASIDAEERPRVLPIRDVYGRTKVAERRRTSRSFTAAPASSSSSGMNSSRSVNLKQAQANFQYGRERPALRVEIPVVPLAVPKRRLSVDVNPSSLAAKRPVVAPISIEPQDSPTISDWSATPPPSSPLKEHSPSPSPIGTLELPPELIDIIISLVSLDEPQRGTYLLNCALVCRSWATAARRHSLCFRHITIPTNERWITFSRVLSSRRCTFRVYTETLSISGHEPPIPQRDALGKRRRFCFDLPHLRTLTLNGSSGVDMKWMGRALELFGRNLVQLNVEHAFFADDYVSDGFVAFFSACPQLEVCSLRDIRGRGDLSRCLEAPPTKLRTLALTNVSELMGHGLLHWLSRFSSVLDLKDVSFGALSEGDCPAIAYFLTSFRRTITSLKLRFSDLAVFEVPLIAQDAFCREVDLGVLSNLQRLELYLPIAGLFTQRDLAAAQVPALLSQIVSPHFVELSLFVLMDQMDNLELVDWASVIEILNRRNFAGMEKIVVHGMSMMPLEEVTRMRRWMIDCVARKLRADVMIVCGPFS